MWVPQAGSGTAPAHAEGQAPVPSSHHATLPKPGQSPSLVHSKLNPPSSSHCGPEMSNLGCKRALASQHPRKAGPCPSWLLLCSSVPSRYWAPPGGSAQAPVTPIQGDSRNSHQWRGLSLPPHHRCTVLHGTNPTLICSPQLKQQT